MSAPLTVDYTAKDYAGFRRLMLDKKREIMPEWTSESPNDFGVVLIELFAYVGDILSFYQDRIATEAFLATAVDRASIVDIARMLDYRPSGTTAAMVDVEITTRSAVVIPAGSRVSTETVVTLSGGEAPVFFETLDELEFTEAGTQAVTCAEGITIRNEPIGSSDGRIDQSFVLNQFPVIEGSPRIFVDEGIGEVEWTAVDRLIEASSTQNAFSTLEDSRGVVTILFGDNVNGRVPATGAVITAEYRVGVGERGNTGPNTLTEMSTADPDIQDAVIAVNNPEAATGGADQESVTSIRRNAPRVFSAQTRAVANDDYAAVALSLSLVAKARAAQVAYNTLAVYVAPEGGGTLTAPQKEEVQELLDDRKMSNITVLVHDADYVPVNIEVSLFVRSEYVRAQVERRVERAVTELLSFAEVDFGHFLPVSDVYDAIAGVEGVSYANVEVLDRDAGSGKDNLQLEDDEIPIPGTITVSATGGITGS